MARKKTVIVAEDVKPVTAKEARNITQEAVELKANIYDDIRSCAKLGRNIAEYCTTNIDKDVLNSVIEKLKADGFIIEPYPDVPDTIIIRW